MFTQIIEKLLPLNYYCELSGIITDSSIIKRIIEDVDTEMIKSLRDNDCEFYLDNEINKWLMNLFIQTVDDSLWYIIWDSFLLEGNIVLFKTTLALIQKLSHEILLIKNTEDAQLVFSKKITANKSDLNWLIYNLIIKRWDFNMKTINEIRDQILPKTIETIRDNGIFNTEIISKTEKCNLNWPLCIKDNKYRHEISQFYVYRCLAKPKIIKEYCDLEYNRESEQKIYNESIKSNNMDCYSNLIIERRKHLCNQKKSEEEDQEEEVREPERKRCETIKEVNSIQLKNEFNQNDVSFVIEKVTNENKKHMSVYQKKYNIDPNNIVFEEN